MIPNEIEKIHLPIHLGIIMDGNGRWAKKQGKVRTFGHRSAMSSVRTVISYCSEVGIKVLTLYTFSTENWKRPRSEVSTLMNLIVEYLIKETPEMKANNVTLNFIGDLSKLPEKALKSIDYAVNETKNNNGLLVNIALNYGGRDEIIRAVKQIAQEVKNNERDIDQIDGMLLSKYLYTSNCPDPDLIIRTGGEKRLSNFMVWQSAYSEFYFTDILWPDFTRKDFDEAMNYYQNRNRRFGGI